MPRRPIPQFPRGPRRRVAPRTDTVLLACPRLSPEWELSALKALVKPQERNRIAHRAGDQAWSPAHEQALRQTTGQIHDLLDTQFDFHLPDSGDYYALAKVQPDGRAAALVWLLSRRLPASWFVFDRLCVKDGVFYRRRRRFELNLTVATDIHLPRGMRARLRSMLGE